MPAANKIHSAAYDLARRLQFLKIHVRQPLGSLRLRKQCRESRCIFVHIPKSAGISIRHSLSLNLGSHTTLARYRSLLPPRVFENCFKFTFVRNPWDRLVSAFLFLKKGGKGNEKWARKHLSAYDDFEAFVRQWVTRKNIWSFAHFRPQFQFICLEEN